MTRKVIVEIGCNWCGEEHPHKELYGFCYIWDKREIILTTNPELADMHVCKRCLDQLARLLGWEPRKEIT